MKNCELAVSGADVLRGRRVVGRVIFVWPILLLFALAELFHPLVRRS